MKLAFFGCIASVIVSGVLIAAEPATNPSPAPLPNPIGKLPGDISIELLGVKVNTPEDRVWWRADGSPLNPGPYENLPNKLTPPPGQRTVEIPLRLTGIEAINTRYKVTGGSAARSGRRGARDEMILFAVFPADLEKTNVRLEVGLPTVVEVQLKPDADPEKRKTQTISKDVPRLGTITLSNPREVDGKAVITATIPQPHPSLQVLVRAVSAGKKPVLATPGGSALRGTEGKPRDIFYDGPLSEVRAFNIETRDYSGFIEFRNVAIKPGVKTEVEVVSSESGL